MTSPYPEQPAAPGGPPTAVWGPPDARLRTPDTAPALGSPASPAKSGHSGRIVAIAAGAGLVAGLLGGFGGSALQDRLGDGLTTGSVQRLPQSSSEAPPLREGSIAAIAAAALPTVVSLAVSGEGAPGTGSGFILRSDGYLLTNNHVISAAADGGRIVVTFNDGSEERGRLVGRSVSYDLGVVKVDRRGLEPAPLGNSGAVRVGDPVIAIGSPLGLNGTVTTGIVSALNRPVTAGGRGEESFISALQTDAAINPGNSGGPLLDAEGKVVGINSAIATLSVGGTSESGSIGLGFAIPVNQAKRISEEIIATGQSRTPVIGVTLDNRYTGPGAKVQKIEAGGPSDNTGLAAGDVIRSVDGKHVADASELIVAIRSHAPGDTITLGLEGGQDVTVTLGVSDDG